MQFSLTSFRRFGLAGRWLAALVCVALLSAGIAHAGHFHQKNPAHKAAESAACQLCAQFDRLAGPPVLATARAPAVVRASVIPTAVLQAPYSPLPHSYEARGPPVVR